MTDAEVMENAVRRYCRKRLVPNVEVPAYIVTVAALPEASVEIATIVTTEDVP